MTEEEKLELMLYIDEEINKCIKEILDSKSKELEKAIIQKAEIDLRADKVVDKLFGKQKIRVLTEAVPRLIERYLRDLDSIKDFSESLKTKLIESLDDEKQKILDQAKIEISKIMEAEKEEIMKMAAQAYELMFFVENSKGRIIEEIVREATKRIEIEDVRPREIHIITPSEKIILPPQLYHEKFETLYKFVRIGLPVMLIGPTGSGKSVCAGQIAEALGIKMYYTNNASEEYKLLGFTDAHGKYKETQFYKAFRDGGLFFLDEIDNSHPSALLSLNSAIGAADGYIYMAFEDGEFTKAHKDFRIIAAANTWGNGASRLYCGRSELDAASLDRFVQVYFDYDIRLEKSIVSDDDLLRFFWDFRKVVNDCGIRHTVTTRNIVYAQKMKNFGFTIEEILLYTIIKELDLEDMKIISQKFKDAELIENEYTREFNSIILKRI